MLPVGQLLGEFDEHRILRKNRQRFFQLRARLLQVFRCQRVLDAGFPLAGKTGNGGPGTLVVGVQIDHPAVSGNDGRQALIGILVQGLRVAPRVFDLRILSDARCGKHAGEPMRLLDGHDPDGQNHRHQRRHQSHPSRG